MDADLRGIGADDDYPRFVPILRWSGTRQKRTWDDHAEFHHGRRDYHSMGVVRLQLVLWAGYRGIDRRVKLGGFERSRSGPKSRLCRDDSPSSVHDLSDDVRDHYASIDHRRICFFLL